MWRQYLKILRTGLPAEAVRKILRDPEVERLGTKIQRKIEKRFARSLAIRQVDAGSATAAS